MFTKISAVVVACVGDQMIGSYDRAPGTLATSPRSKGCGDDCEKGAPHVIPPDSYAHVRHAGPRWFTDLPTELLSARCTPRSMHTSSRRYMSELKRADLQGNEAVVWFAAIARGDGGLGGPACCERRRMADQLPALGLGELVLPGGHWRRGDTVADPVIDLTRRVLRDVQLEVERPRREREGRGTVAQTLWAVADGAVLLVKGLARGDRLGRVRHRVLGESRGERDGRRRDVRRDRVGEPERDEGESAEDSGARREAAPGTAAAGREEREEREEHEADRHDDRELLHALAADGERHLR